MSGLAEVQALANADPLGVAYAGILAAGGLFGFLRAQSLPSLVAGLTFATASLLGVRRNHQIGNPDLILAASGILSLVMGLRYSRSGKFMPPGLLTILSLATLARYGSKLL